jgi:hypothetical protein
LFASIAKQQVWLSIKVTQTHLNPAVKLVFAESSIGRTPLFARFCQKHIQGWCTTPRYGIPALEMAPIPEAEKFSSFLYS